MNKQVLYRDDSFFFLSTSFRYNIKMSGQLKNDDDYNSGSEMKPMELDNVGLENITYNDSFCYAICTLTGFFLPFLSYMDLLTASSVCVASYCSIKNRASMRKSVFEKKTRKIKCVVGGQTIDMLQEKDVSLHFKCKLNLTINYGELLQFIHNEIDDCGNEYKNESKDPYGSIRDGPTRPRFLVMCRYKRGIKSDLNKLMNIRQKYLSFTKETNISKTSNNFIDTLIGESPFVKIVYRSSTKLLKLTDLEEKEIKSRYH